MTKDVLLEKHPPWPCEGFPHLSMPSCLREDTVSCCDANHSTLPPSGLGGRGQLHIHQVKHSWEERNWCSWCPVNVAVWQPRNCPQAEKDPESNSCCLDRKAWGSRAISRPSAPCIAVDHKGSPGTAAGTGGGLGDPGPSLLVSLWYLTRWTRPCCRSYPAHWNLCCLCNAVSTMPPVSILKANNW